MERIKEHKKLKIRTYSMSGKMSVSLIFGSERERSVARIFLGGRRVERLSDFLEVERERSAVPKIKE